jgi:hypothetical protein
VNHIVPKNHKREEILKQKNEKSLVNIKFLFLSAGIFRSDPVHCVKSRLILWYNIKMEEEKYKILRDREIVLTPLYWNTISQTSDKSKEIFGVNQQLIFSYLKDGRAKQIHVEKYWRSAGEYIANRYLKDKRFFEKIKNLLKDEGIKANKFILKIRKVEMSRLSVDELIKFTNNIQQSWLTYDEVNVPAWFWPTDYFAEKLKNELNIDSDDFLVFSTPDKLTYSSQLEVDLLKKLS